MAGIDIQDRNTYNIKNNSILYNSNYYSVMHGMVLDVPELAM